MSDDRPLEEGEVILHPITGEPVMDNSLKLAIIEGAFVLLDEGRTLKIDWQKLMRHRMILRAKPIFHGFTKREMELWNKVYTDTLLPIYEVPAFLGADMRFTIDLCLREHVPIYVLKDRKYVFWGDVVRLVDCQRLDTDAEGGILGEYLKKWATAYDARQSPVLKDRKRAHNDRRPTQATARGRPRGNQQDPGSQRWLGNQVDDSARDRSKGGRPRSRLRRHETFGQVTALDEGSARHGEQLQPRDVSLEPQPSRTAGLSQYDPGDGGGCGSEEGHGTEDHRRGEHLDEGADEVPAGHEDSPRDSEGDREFVERLLGRHVPGYPPSEP